MGQGVRNALEDVAMPAKRPVAGRSRRGSQPTWTDRSFGGVRLRLTQNFPRRGRNVALAEEDETRQVLQRIAFDPAEVGMGRLAKQIAHGQQHGGNRIRNGGAFGSQNVKSPDLLPGHPYRRSEVRGILDRDFEEEHGVAGGDWLASRSSRSFKKVLAGVALIRVVGDDANRSAAAASLISALPFVEVNRGRAQLSRAEATGDQRDDDDGADEEGGNLDAIRSFDDVGHRGVDEDERDDAEAEVCRRCPAERAARVTATEAEVISTRTPVAYAPA